MGDILCRFREEVIYLESSTSDEIPWWRWEKLAQEVYAGNFTFSKKRGLDFKMLAVFWGVGEFKSLRH